MGGHGYSSLLVCLFVIAFSTHLDATALHLQPSHNNINSGRF